MFCDSRLCTTGFWQQETGKGWRRRVESKRKGIAREFINSQPKFPVFNPFLQSILDNRKAEKKLVRIDRLQSFLCDFLLRAHSSPVDDEKKKEKCEKDYEKSIKPEIFAYKKGEALKSFSVFTLPICKSSLHENCDLVILMMMVFYDRKLSFSSCERVEKSDFERDEKGLKNWKTWKAV